MADNVEADPGTGGAVFATDEITSLHYPITKITFGALDSQTLASSGNGTTDAGTQRVTISSDSTGIIGATLSAETTKVIGTVNIASSQTIAVTNTGTFAVQVDGAALTALQLIDDPVFADDAPFTLTSSKTMVAGAIRDDSASTLSAAEGDVVPLRVNSLGRLQVESNVFDPGTIDGLGHLLTNEAVNQIEIQFFRDTPANLLTVTTAGGGATSQVGGAGKFETSTAGTANAKGVTGLSTSYRSASEIFTFFSVLFTTPTDAGSFQRIGLYDDNNGVFMGFEGNSFGVTIRNGASDTTIAKASFSEDDLTGAAGSFFTRVGVPEAIDLTKFNLFRVRYGWFGSAPLFYEVLSPDDKWVTFHVIRQPNSAVIASMENPDLPMTVHVSKTASDATNLIILTNCWAAGVTSGALPLNETLTDANLAKVSRTIIAGKNPGGNYVNFGATTAGNFKISVQEISDGLDVGAGNAGAETQRVSISTDDVNLAAINAGQLPDGHNVTVDNASIAVDINAGTNLIGKVGIDQVTANANEVVTKTGSVTKLESNTGVDIGDVDILSIAAGTNLIGKMSIDQVTANANEVVTKTGSVTKLEANSGIDIGDVDVTSISAGATLIGDVGLSGARTSGGTTLYKNIDVDESEDQVKATAGQVYWIHAINTTAAIIYLKFYNLAAASVTVGTTVPDLTFPVPGNSTTGAGFTLSIPNGIEFGTGITIAATTGVADNNAGAPAANALVVNLGFA